jgi:phage anti-repressor protein
MELQLHTENDDLYQLMKVQMSSEQEQMFMISHYLYLQHGNDSTKFIVDFDNVWKNVEFTRLDNAKRILVKNFTEHIDYKIAAPHLKGAAFTEHIDYKIAAPPKCKVVINGKNLGGSGQNKETILLTVDCFKNFCMLAATPKAKEIRFYYIKMENIMHEYYKNFRIKNSELQTTLLLSQNALQISQKETAIKRHEVLIESNKNKWVVYFCRIQLYDDGSFILKVGETVDIKNRMDVLRCDFGTSLIVLDVFICENSIKFEKSLHNSSELVRYKYDKLEHKNKKISTEAYHIPNQKEYEKIVKFTNIKLIEYNGIEVTKLRIEEKKIDLVASLIPCCKNYDEILNIMNTIKSSFCEYRENPTSDKIDTLNIQLENVVIKHNFDIVIEPINQQDPQTTPNSTGPIVQIYHISDLTKVVQVYNSIMEATRDFNYNIKPASFTAIKKAHQYKTIYLDYRWHFISNRQEQGLDQPRDIGETVITQERNQGQVAMMTIDKTKIIKVFKLAKDAAKEILQHPSAMCSAIKHSSPLNNYYWVRWENIEGSIQDEFLESNTLPIPPTNTRGTQIKQMDPFTNELVKLFASYTDVQKELKISVKKVKELIDTQEIYNGKYRFCR